MEMTATMPAASMRARRLSARLDAPALGAWTLAFALVAYLALRNGGYDTVVRSEVGVAVWWVVLLAALAGVLPARVGAAGWVAIGLLGAFAVWTGLAIGWSESAGRSVVELGRVAAYLGVLVLAIALQGRAGARHTIGGLACAIGLVTVLAVLSRLHPQAFPANDHFRFLGPASARRLSYPLNYWNALAAFAAIGVPLLLASAVGARTVAGRALAAATLPLSAICMYLTISRGGVLALCAGVAVFLLLAPRRLEAVGTLLASGAGAAILVWATSQRDALTSGVPSQAAIHQGTRLMLLAAIVCAGVALLQVAIALAARHLTRPPALVVGRRATARLALALAVAAAIVAVAAGAPSALQHRWHDFRQPTGVVVPSSDATVFARLQAVNGNGRYQFWQAALHANATAPWQGIGPGTFELWWARHATSDGFIRNAHSLYFETLAETGIAGLALLGGLLLWLAGVAVRRSLRAPPGLRLWIAAASGGLAAFLVAAALEWVWQLAAIAAAALVLGAVIVAGRDEPRADAAAPPRARRGPRAALAILAIAALGAVLVPLAGELAIRRSRADAAAGRLTAAYRDSVAAQRLQPYAATPRLQQALVLEAAGELAPAAAAAQAATTNEPTDWQTWIALARIDARRGATSAALAAMRRARALDPRSTVFRRP
ncbi:MAG TPA: O-antigen ligase family protein [Conexibacter sp.]|jgi:O-antigen ligase|nr:O-antigen ligase family protein [Conexibacter sp.]